MKWGKIFLALGILAITGCTKSIPLTYKEGVDIKEISVNSNHSIGITDFKDSRSFAKLREAKASSFIATQGPWKFGITYDGIEYIPVTKLVHKLFIKELKSSGFKVKSLDLTPQNQEVVTLQNIASNENVDYILSGEIITFEFVNATGVWTVTSSRNIALSLNLISKEGVTIFDNSNFHVSNSENEGMGVLHTTNVDKLMNIAFKDVLTKVMSSISTKIGSNQIDFYIKIAVNNAPMYLYKYMNGSFVRV